MIVGRTGRRLSSTKVKRNGIPTPVPVCAFLSLFAILWNSFCLSNNVSKFWNSTPETIADIEYPLLLCTEKHLSPFVSSYRWKRPFCSERYRSFFIYLFDTLSGDRFMLLLCNSPYQYGYFLFVRAFPLHDKILCFICICLGRNHYAAKTLKCFFFFFKENRKVIVYLSYINKSLWWLSNVFRLLARCKSFFNANGLNIYADFK